MSTPSRPETWVIKSGTRLLDGDPIARIRSWSAQLAEIAGNKEVNFVWVFSGTLARARRTTGSNPASAGNRQALGAIGQMALIREFSEALEGAGLVAGQILVRSDDLFDPARAESFARAIRSIHELRGVAVVNENDARGESYELLANNDFVAEEIARLLRADKLVFLSDVDGVYDRNPAVVRTDGPPPRRFSSLTPEEAHSIASDAKSEEASKGGTGGMRSKLLAAAAAAKSGVETWIASGTDRNLLRDIADGTANATRILPGEFGATRRTSDPASEARRAARVLGTSSISSRNSALAMVGQEIGRRRAEILAANQADLRALAADVPAAFRDRMTLSEARITDLLAGLTAVLESDDPLDSLRSEADNGSPALEHRLGLRIRQVRAPLGVLFMIFESRPNVAVEAFSSALKSGNALILRGGKECRQTLGLFYSIFESALERAGLPAEAFRGITDPDRRIVARLLKRRDAIDVVIPRGGDGLIDFVVRTSLVPIIKNDRGMCHVYVDADAADDVVLAVVPNAKIQRPGVCNAAETLLIHRAAAPRLLPKLHSAMESAGLRWFACPAAREILGPRNGVESARDEHWDTEHLDLRMNCRVVESYEEALEHISRHGSRHSEAILTEDPERARHFHASVDAAVTYRNVSTRFTDGFEFGLASEIGISTQKLHVRGPVGTRDLTSLRWTVDGIGQTRSTT